MLNAVIVRDASVACPVCRTPEHRTLRRVPAPTEGHVVNHCVCARCSTSFSWEEDRVGRPVPRP